MAYFGNFGGIMTLVLLATGSFLAPIISFQTDLALSHKLYTVLEQPGEAPAEDDGPDDDDPENKSPDEAPGEKLTQRVPFDYPVLAAIGDWMKANLFCCCSCCKCCQQSPYSN